MTTKFHDHIEQGSQEWHAMRNSRIAASDIPVLMARQTVTLSEIPDFVKFESIEGEKVTLQDHPFRTIGSLWKEKKLGVVEVHSDYALAMFEYGHEQEAGIIQEISDELFIKLRPLVATKDDWMMASLDGVSSDRKIGGEGKAPVLRIVDGEKIFSTALKLALEGKIPDYYWTQTQWQMAVAGLEKVYFGVRNPVDGKLLGPFEILPNKQFIEQMTVVARNYADQFFTEIEEWEVYNRVADEFARMNDQIKAIEAKMAPLKESLIEFSKTQPVAQVHFQRLYVAKNKGRTTTDYKGFIDTLTVSDEQIAPFRTIGEDSFTVRTR
jgi:hypothetical protein